MDSVGSETCVETATEQEYSHVQAVESFTPRKKLKQPDMSRTRWLGGGGSGGAAAGSLSLSLFWAACPRNPQGLLHLCLGDLRSDHTSKRARILIEKALGCQRSSFREAACQWVAWTSYMGNCAVHFRSFEMMHVALVDMVQAHSSEVCLAHAVEKHLKHECDRVSGRWHTGLKRLSDDKAN